LDQFFKLFHCRYLEEIVSKFAEPMARLIDELKKLPGVGSKSAQRMAFHILRSSGEDAEALAAAIRNLKEKLHLCSICNNITDVDPCSYCSNATRNQRLVCVVEEPTNIASIEKARFYNGVYHVLHGAISPLHGVGPEQLRIPSLLKRIESGSVDEVIIATNPTIEGEATAIHLSGLLKRPGLKVTRIATGIPAGSDIEYADEVTMLKAMEGRREL
jgi:recombination protein RecR